MANRLPPSGYILGLDVGEKRIGAAVASVIARLPQPLNVVSADSSALERIAQLAGQNEVALIVIGIPRNLEGDETPQSRKIRDFAARLKKQVDVPIEFADESLSSVRADSAGRQLDLRNVSRDSVAACFILEEFLGTIER